MNLKSNSPKLRIHLTLQIGKCRMRLSVLKTLEWTIIVLSLAVHIAGLILHLRN